MSKLRLGRIPVSEAQHLQNMMEIVHHAVNYNAARYSEKELRMVNSLYRRVQPELLDEMKLNRNECRFLEGQIDMRIRALDNVTIPGYQKRIDRLGESRDDKIQKFKYGEYLERAREKRAAFEALLERIQGVRNAI